MTKCVKSDSAHRFKQVTWETFAQEIRKWQALREQGFWNYFQKKLPNI